MPEPRKLRMGVVGLGWVGSARHIPTISANPAYELVGVADRSAERVAQFAKANGKVRACQAKTLSAIDWIDEVDAISVATAPMAHHDLVCEGLARGLHVITEKPFAMTPGEGAAMVAAAADADRTLAVVHNFQFARSMEKLDRDIASGHLGRIRGVRALQLGNPSRRLPTWYQQLPLGLFYDESPHLLYLLSRVAGPLSLAKAVCVHNPDGQATPYQIDAWFRSDSEFPVTMSCCFEASVSEWYLLVHGEKSVAIVDIFRDIYIRLPNDGSHATAEVIRTSFAATAQHWAQHGTSGLLHVLGKLRYGNDHVFDRFARGVAGDKAALAPIDAAAAQRVLALQHDIISNAERL